jgi:hypothetical protein
MVYYDACLSPYPACAGGIEYKHKRLPKKGLGRAPPFGARPARCALHTDAIAVERKLKGWTRAKKEALTKADWAKLMALAKRRGGKARS